MKKTVRFALAKYVPDLQRMEPRNLGVVVWAEGGIVASRFLGENSKNHLAIVERESRRAYRQWLTYWKYYLNSHQISDKQGNLIERTKSEFFDALLHKSKEQFRLVDSGHFSHKLSENELADVVNDLFVRLVEKPGMLHSELTELKESCDKLFEALESPVKLHHNFPLPSRVFGVHRTFTVDYVFGETGKPAACLQRVLLTRHQSLDSNAFLFQALTRERESPFPKENCAALVTKDQPIGNEGLAGLNILSQFATVIDVSSATALRELEQIASRTSLN